MPAELWNTAVWPSPAAEEEVRARVAARTRTLRRRRALPFVGLAALVLVGAVVLPQNRSSTRVGTVGVTAAPETPTTTAVAPPTESPAPTTPRSGQAVRPTRTADEPRTTPPPIEERVRPLITPRYPDAPVPADRRPLLTDPEGDAWVQVELTRAESDPTCDITELDVRADARGVTATLRVLDPGREPRESVTEGKPRYVYYYATLHRPEGFFNLYVDWRHDSGTASAGGTLSTPRAEAGSAGAWRSTYIEGVVGDVNVHTGIVRLTVTFEALNRALQEASPGSEPIGVGSTVVPEGNAGANHGTSVVTHDTVQSDDPNFAYRLGD